MRITVNAIGTINTTVCHSPVYADKHASLCRQTYPLGYLCGKYTCLSRQTSDYEGKHTGSCSQTYLFIKVNIPVDEDKHTCL